MAQEAPEIEAVGEDVTALNEELLESLRMLNYEKEYVSKGGKAITISAFSVQTNPTEQFANFKNLVKYLFQINDIPTGDFSKYDDPMTVSTNIINECKKIQINCDCPPLKLKGGCGDQVLIILTQLASKGLKKKNFSFKKPRYQDAAVDAQPQEEGGKAGDNDEMIDQADMASEDDIDDREAMGVAAVDEEKQIIVSAVNENDWKLECERVANKLKIQTKTDGKEWRSHIDSTKGCSQLIKKNFPNAKAVLEKLNDELSRTIDKVQKSERIINSNMSDVGENYRNQSQQLKKLSNHYNNMSAALKQINQNYRIVSEKLEQIQQKTDGHSSTMTDNSPVAKIKQSLIKLSAEIKSMDVRMGVLNHTILQYKSRERGQDKKVYKNIEAQDLYDFE